jgi:hypothetical protein
MRFKPLGKLVSSVQITGLYSWGPPEIASRVEIDVVGQYLKPYLDTIDTISSLGEWLNTFGIMVPQILGELYSRF